MNTRLFTAALRRGVGILMAISLLLVPTQSYASPTTGGGSPSTCLVCPVETVDVYDHWWGGYFITTLFDAQGNHTLGAPYHATTSVAQYVEVDSQGDDLIVEVKQGTGVFGVMISDDPYTTTNPVYYVQTGTGVQIPPGTWYIWIDVRDTAVPYRTGQYAELQLMTAPHDPTQIIEPYPEPTDPNPPMDSGPQ